MRRARGAAPMAFFHPPLEGGSKNPRDFSGRGMPQMPVASPSPKNLLRIFRPSLKGRAKRKSLATSLLRGCLTNLCRVQNVQRSRDTCVTPCTDERIATAARQIAQHSSLQSIEDG